MTQYFRTLLVLILLSTSFVQAQSVQIELKPRATPGEIVVVKVSNDTRSRGMPLSVQFVSSDGKIEFTENLGPLEMGNYDRMMVIPKKSGSYTLNLAQGWPAQQTIVYSRRLIIAEGQATATTASEGAAPDHTQAPPSTSEPVAGPNDWLLGEWILDNNGDIKVANWAPHRGMRIVFRQERDGVSGYIVKTNSSCRDYGWRDGQQIYRRGITNPGPFPAPWTVTTQGEFSDSSGQWGKQGLGIRQSSSTGMIKLPNFWTYNFRKSQKPESNYYSWTRNTKADWHQLKWTDEGGAQHRTAPGDTGLEIVEVQRGTLTLKRAANIRELDSRGTLIVEAPLTFRSGGVASLTQRGSVRAEDKFFIDGKSSLESGTLEARTVRISAPVQQSASHTLSEASLVSTTEDGEFVSEGEIKLSSEGIWDNQGLLELTGQARATSWETLRNSGVLTIRKGLDLTVSDCPQIRELTGVLSRPLLEQAHSAGLALVDGSWEIAGSFMIKQKKPIRALGRNAELILRGKGRFHNLGHDRNSGIINVGSLELRDNAYCILSFYEQMDHGNLFIESGSVLKVNVATLNRFAVFQATGGTVRIDGKLEVFDINDQKLDDKRVRFGDVTPVGTGTINGTPVANW